MLAVALCGLCAWPLMAQKRYQLQSVPLVTTKRRCVKMMNVLSPCLAGLDPVSFPEKR